MKKITSKINNFITYIMIIIENSVTAIGDDKVLLGFLIGGFIPNFIIKLKTEMAIFNLRSLIFNFAWYSLIVAFSYLFKNNRKRLIYFSIVTVFAFIATYSNITYYYFYESFISLSLYKQLGLFGDVADATQVAITPFDIYYWVLLLLSIVLLYYGSRKTQYNGKDIETRVFKRKNFIKMAIISFVAGILTLAPGNYSQAAKLWNRPVVVENFGLYNYHLIDVVKSMGVFIEPKPTESDYEEFITYFNEKNRSYRTNEYTNMFKGKNVLVIHAESIENFLINREINGEEITPNFNKIANSGYYFNNFYAQQSIGTSADSEFVFNTSLLPVNNGTIFLTHFERTYITTQKLLRENGYFTAYMHGNNGSFWNRNVMSPVLGYDMFYEKDSYRFGEEETIGLGISDYEFFKQSIDIINNFPEPYYATLITLTNHTPWEETNKYFTYDDYGNKQAPFDCGDNLEDTTLCNYLQASHYADWAFGEFIKSLESHKALDDTVLLIYGDHKANLEHTEMEELYGKDMTKIEYKSKQQVPFIIYSKSMTEPKVIDTVMGQYDVGPTIQNMLGVKNEFALGQDIFNLKHNLVAFVNGDWTDGIIYYDSFRDDYFIVDEKTSEDMITDEYLKIQNSEANKIINMSNMINRLNLIGYYEERNKVKVETSRSGY